MPLLRPYKRALEARQQGQSGQRLNLDGGSFHAGGIFELFHKGSSWRRRIEHGTGRFYFIFSDTDETADLLPGIQARLLP